MSKRHTSYKSDTKHGFEAGELAALFAKHAGADYRVVISMKGKIRELIVEDELEPATGERVECAADDQRHGGKVEATFHPDLTDEALNARFGDPRLGNLDRLHSGERLPGGSMRRSWDGPRP